jgi:voltage-gated potassium channel
MLDETRLERRLDRAVARATTPRGAAVVIALVSIAVTIASGIVMTVAEHERYQTIGSGLWWAVQTTTTVGYGDNVPTTAAGRIVAAAVMLFGIGFLAVITAAITSTFVARSRLESIAARTPDEDRRLDARLERIEAAVNADAPTGEQLRELDKRLERIEAALTRRA